MASAFDTLFGDSPIDQALQGALAPVMQKIGGGTPDQTTRTAPPPPPPPDEQKPPTKQPMSADDALPLIEKYESGGRNILQQVVDPKISTASGYYQITNSTWRNIAPKAGIDLAKYPTAMSAPRSVQALGATALYNEQGFEPWAPYNKSLSSALGRGDSPKSQVASPMSSTSDEMEEAKKSAPYGLVVLGADGSFMNYKGEKLSVQPKPRKESAPVNQSQEEFERANGIDKIRARIAAEKAAKEQADIQSYNNKKFPAVGSLLADPNDPNDPMSIRARDEKAYDLVLSGQAPNLDVARQLVGNRSAAQLVPPDPAQVKKNRDALQNKSLSILGNTLPGPLGIISNLAANSEVVKTVATMGLDIGNTFNIAETAFPKAYDNVRQLLDPQSEAGKTIAKYGGGAVKTLAEIGILHHAMAPGFEDMDMDAAQQGGAIFGTNYLLNKASDVVGGKTTALEALPGLPAEVGLGATFGEATSAFKESALATLENTPPALQNIGARVGAGVGAATVSTAFGGNTDDALNLGIFAALAEKPGGELRARNVERQAAKVQDAVRNFAEASGIDLSAITPEPEAPTTPSETRAEGPLTHSKLADVGNGKVLVETKDESGALTNQEMSAEKFNALPKTDDSQQPTANSGADSQSASEEPSIEPPHVASAPGKYVTSEPLTEEPYTSKAKKYEGKTRSGVWVDDPDGSIAKAIIGDKGVLARDGKTFIPKKNIQRPEGFEEPTSDTGPRTSDIKEKNNVAATGGDNAGDNLGERGADANRVEAVGNLGEQLAPDERGTRPPNSPGGGRDESGTPQAVAEGGAAAGGLGADEGLGINALEDWRDRRTAAIEKAALLNRKGIVSDDTLYDKYGNPIHRGESALFANMHGEQELVKIIDFSNTEGDAEFSPAAKVAFERDGKIHEIAFRHNDDGAIVKNLEGEKNATTARIEPSDNIAEHQGNDELVEGDGKDRQLAGVGPEESAANSGGGGLSEIEKQKVVDALPVNTSSPVKEINDYAIRNRIPVDKSWGNTLKNIREDAITKAQEKMAAQKEVPSPLKSSGTLSAEILPGLKALGEEVGSIYSKDIKPAAEHIAEGIGEVAHNFKASILPGSVGQGKITSQILREQLGLSALSMSRADAAFNDAKKLFNSFTAEQQDKFTSTMESGESTGDKNLDEVKDAVRGFLDADRELIRRTAPNALREFYENYFPHLWKDPGRAERLIRATNLTREAPELKEANAAMEKMSSAEKRAFLKQTESGEAFSDPEKEKYASALRAYAEAHPDISLGLLLGHRPFAGRKGFLKERTYATFQEGLEAGLEPITHNPIEAMLLHHGQVMKFIAATNTLNDLRARGIRKYVSVFDKPPAGYTMVDDATSTVYGDPDIPIWEAKDVNIMGKLNDFARSLGITHERLAKIGGTRMGYSEQGGMRVVTKFGGSERTLAHEIGHQLDAIYGLKEKFVNNPENKLELRDLADQRYKSNYLSRDASDSYKRYVRKGDEKMAVMLESYIWAPDIFKFHAPDTYNKFTDFLNAHEELKPLTEIRPSLASQTNTSTVNAGGMVVRGHWYVPEDAARVINNYLSPGLWDKKWYSSLRSLGNAMNQFQLSLSAFHAHFASLDAITSQVALGVKQIANKDFSKGIKSIVTSPSAPFVDYGVATKLKAELLQPGTHPEFSELAKAFSMSGLRLSMDPAYRTNMRDKLREVWKEPNSTLRSLLKVPGAAVETAMSPILEKLVPNLKIGAFAQAAQYELERLGPDATRDQKRLAYQKIGESIENRLGQIAYDNLHWNRTMKDVFMLSVRSVGWNFGSLREGVGGIADWGKFIAKSGGKREFTDRMAYTIALPFTVGIYGALLNGIMTGITTGTPQLPSTESLGAFLKDIYYPQTGQTDEDGRPKRVALPSYMKDVAHFAQGVMDVNPREIVNMGTSKLHPFWGWIAETLNNRDFYNTQIWNGDDPALKIGGDVLKHFGTAFIPFSARGYMKSSQLDEPIANRLLQTAGLPPAPASLNETPAERKMYEYIHGRLPQGVQTEAQTERHTTMNLIERQIRLGHKDFAEGMKSKALLENKISRNDIEKIDRRAQTDKKIADFKMLDPLESLNVMEKANTAEYPKFYKELQTKGANLKEDRFTPEEWGDMRERFSKYGISIGSGGGRRSGSSGFGKGFGGSFKSKF